MRHLGGPPRGGRKSGRHLRRGIFLALGTAIVLSVVVAGLVVHSGAGTTKEQHAFESFASDRFRSVWDDPVRRADLASSIERHFDVHIALRDPEGRMLYGAPNPCPRASHSLVVRDGARSLGKVEACVKSHAWPKSVIFGLGSLVLVLWAMSGFIARRLVRPLDDLVRVVQDIGDGHLDARIRLCQHQHRGEIGAVAQAVNLMAEKIERQIAGQRELLAAVSHEIRSPLARLRMLVELEREQSADVTSRLDEMDVELAEMDALVGQLLAQSRLEFQRLELRDFPAVSLAVTALERAGVSREVLDEEVGNARVRVDVGLLGRALLNVLENAVRHGGGVERIQLRMESAWITFEIRDRGNGFDPKLLPRAFEAFVGTSKGGGLGLGLSLVRRIVQAHGGRVSLANAAEGGAVVTIDLPRNGEE